ncbi:MAG TPA: iron-siderophore ABC transporter permease [Firmicutes bacterium]|nr:iron-siderophore ABC transporter permease [Bacillota bacterium]
MKHKSKANSQFFFFSLLGLGLVLLVSFIHIRIGMSQITYQTIMDSIFQPDGSQAHLIISTIRLPRILLGIFVGASMAMSGLLIQRITANPLASPQVLGINAGASLAVVIMIVFFPMSSSFSRMILAFIGAGLIGAFVQFMGYVKKLNALQLTLVGLSVQLLLSAITKAIMLLNESKTSDLLFWMSGAIHQAQMKHIQLILPWFVLALCLSLSVSRGLDALKLGEAVATSLGTRTVLTKSIGVVSVIIFAGSAVAIAGPIAFIGLMTPHLVSRIRVKAFSQHLILCGIYGANLLLISDVIAKLLKYPYESPVGIVTSFLGAIFYIILTKQHGKRGVLNEK